MNIENIRENWQVANMQVNGDVMSAVRWLEENHEAIINFLLNALDSYATVIDALDKSIKCLEVANIAGQSLYNANVTNEARAALEQAKKAKRGE